MFFICAVVFDKSSKEAWQPHAILLDWSFPLKTTQMKRESKVKNPNTNYEFLNFMLKIISGNQSKVLNAQC